ncbi:MAG: beta strand repeat-containing protein, partial [Thermoguttaceae bacterium]
SLDPTLGISQLAGNALTAGTWSALNGASLQFPTSITSNAANLNLSGSGATITGISGLSSNSGSFTLDNGANFSTTGNFTNSGSLTVGAGSTLSVTGNETETSAGTLNVQIGGTPASGQFGHVAATGIATLAGTFSLALVNGFAASVGQDFKAMTFASASGTFSTVNLGSSFTEAINPTSLDLNSTVANPTDLSLSNVAAPTAATAGQQITVTWQVTNQSTNNATANWQDSVYLSSTRTITSSSILLGAAQHSGGLNANGSYNGTLSAPVPALAPGSYYVLVQADSLYQVSDPNRANNTLAATSQVNVSLPALDLGTPFNDSFTAADQDHYYQVSVPAGGTLGIALASAASSGATALYVSQGRLPTPFNFDFGAALINQPNQTVLVPQVLIAGTYYVLAHSVSGNASTAAFTLTATQSGALAVTSIPSVPSGNGGNATVEIDGTNFASNITASLTLNSATINATSIQFVNASKIFAVFNLAGVATGNYTLKVQQGAQSATAPTTFHVVPATIGNPLQLDLNTPDLVRAGRGGVDYVTVTNISNNDVPAPLLVLSSDGATLNLPSNPAFTPTSLTFLATSPTGKAGTLTADESVTVTIDFQSTTTNPTINFDLSQTDTTQPFDWSKIAAGVAQYESNVPNATAALTYLENEVGSTWGDYIAMLDRNANLVPQQLGSPNDPKVLFSLEFDKALAAVNTSLSGSLQSSQPGVNLAGLSVYAVDTTSGASFATTTLNDGSFVFSTLPASTYTLSVDGVLLTSNPTFTLSTGQSLTGAVLTATQGAQIAGQVLSQASSMPIAGATVQATNEADGQGFTVTADANGDYDLAGLPAGTYDLVVTATGYAQAEVLGVDVTQSNAREAVTLTAQSSISGTVALGSGGAGETTLQVIAGISGSTDANQTYITTSTSSGFTLDGLPAGTYDVTLSLPGYITQTISSVVVGAGQSLNLGTITLAPASEIDGTVTSTDSNNPAGQMLVEALQGSTVVGSTITDSSGNFQITNLSPGTYTLAAPLGAVVTAPTVTVALGQTVTGQSILVQPGGTIIGAVTGPAIAPLAGMSVFLAGPGGLSEATTTDSNGNYQFTGLNTGSYQVYLLIGGAQTSQAVSVTSLDGTAVTANLQLAYAAMVTGTLTDGSGNPITDGTVLLYQSGQAIANAQTNAAGVYTFLIIQPGTFDLAALASEGTFGVVTGLVVNAGSAVTQNFQTGSGTLAISVNDGGQPVTGDSVAVEAIVDGALTVIGQTTVAADGTASFSGLAAGNYTVAVADDNGDAGSGTVSVSAGGSANTNVSLAAQATVVGTITDSSANPLSGATVLFQLSTNLQQVSAAITAADGTYSIVGLAPGTYDVTVFANGYLATTQAGVVVSTTATVNASLTKSDTTLNGTLVDSSGNPVPSGSVMISDTAGHILGTADVNPDGSFSVTSAQGNNLVLQVSAQGYAPGTVSINVATGTTTQLNPVVLQAVAMDPNAPSAPNAQPQGPIPPDGQAWADQEAEKALGYKVTPPSSPAAPTCPNCMPLYTNLVLPNFEAAKESARTLNDLVSKIPTAATAVTVAVGVDSAQLLALEGVAALINIKGISGAMQKLSFFSKVTPLGINTVAILPAIGEVGGAVASLDQDVVNMLQAGSFGEIGQIASKAASDAEQLIGILTKALADYTTEGIKNVFAASGASQLYNQITGYLNIFLNITTPKPFEATVVAASLLDDNVQQEDPDASDYYRDLANFQKASDLLARCDMQPCQPNPPTQQPPQQKKTPNKDDADPNALIGPAGIGTQAFVQATGPFGYTVQFENDGTAAAQDVTVTEQLDPNLDWSTFQLGSFGFGPVNVTIPAGLTQYQTTVAYQNTDGSSLNVQVALDFNVQTGLLTVAFTSLDPATGEAPTGVFDGFLPPDNSSGIGEGYVQYTVQPKNDLTTGATISQQASVVFDINAAIMTNAAVNTIDSGPPTSSVNPLPAVTTSSSFTVSWSGQDDTGGSGIATY